MSKFALLILWIFNRKEWDKRRLAEAEMNMAAHCASDEDWRILCEDMARRYPLKTNEV